MAGNDTQGLRYGTIETPEKYYLEWKEQWLNGDLRLSAGISYRDDVNLFNLPNTGEPVAVLALPNTPLPPLDADTSYTLIDASAIWDVNDQWRLSFVGRNLTDEQKVDLDQAKAVALMTELPTLVRRPVLDRDGAFKAGFKDADYQALFAE